MIAAGVFVETKSYIYMCTDRDGIVLLMEWVLCFKISLQHPLPFTSCCYFLLRNTLFVIFISPDTYDQLEVPEDLFGKKAKYLQGRGLL